VSWSLSLMCLLLQKERETVATDSHERLQVERPNIKICDSLPSVQFSNQ